jgi:hypothetical protein
LGSAAPRLSIFPLGTGNVLVISSGSDVTAAT